MSGEKERAAATSRSGMGAEAAPSVRSLATRRKLVLVPTCSFRRTAEWLLLLEYFTFALPYSSLQTSNKLFRALELLAS